MSASSGRVLAVVVVGAALFVGAALASNSASFGDRAGDADPAPDVTGLAISSDDAGLVTVNVSLGNRSVLGGKDEVTVGVDADQNPDSGGVFYGADFELTLLGATSHFLLPGRDGYYYEANRPASFEASLTNGVATFLFKASEVGIASGFNVYALGFVPGAVDTAPEVRTFNYQLVSGALPPVLGPDGRAPLDEALPAKGVHGKLVRLWYFAADGRGETSDTIRVIRRGRTIKRVQTRVEDSNPFFAYNVEWRIPKKIRGKLRFCVSSTDRAENRGLESCAPLTIR